MASDLSPTVETTGPSGSKLKPMAYLCFAASASSTCGMIKMVRHTVVIDKVNYTKCST